MLPFFGSPEDLEKARAEFQKQLEQAEAEHDLMSHQVVRVMNDLDEETTFVFTKVLAQVRDAGNVASIEAVTASYWIGVLRARLQMLGVCMSCGKHHDEELLNLQNGIQS